LSEKAGLLPSLVTSKKRKTTYGSTNISWIVKLRPWDSHVLPSIKQIESKGLPKKSLAHKTEAGIYRRVKKIEKEFYTGSVFTLSVEDIHSYTLENVVVHNCEHIYLSNGVVSQCIERVVKYPLTSLQFATDNEELVDKYEEMFYSTLNFKTFMGDVGTDLYNYGNSFVSVFFPFTRILKCSKCKLETPIARALKVKFEEFKFHAQCRCGNKGIMEVIDRRSLDAKKINLIRWNPKQVDISFNPVTGEYQYYYNIPQDMVGRIKGGDINLVAGLPQVYLDTVKKNNVIKVSKDYIFHMKTTSLAGLNQEWGIPPTFRTFKLHYYNAILRRANEAIALDYLVPIRILYPESRGQTDPGQMLNMRKYRDAALGMIKQHRVDPGDAYFFPMPVGYQAIGGEMKALNVNADIKLANEEIMNSLGFPQELFYGSLSVQAAPVALRLLENTLSNWIDGMNSLTQWISDKVSVYFDLPTVKVSWTKVTLVDDLEKKNLLMQLVGAQKIADDTFLNTIGTSVTEEMKKKFKQQKIEAEETKKFQEDIAHLQEQKQQDSGQGQTPQDVQAKAQQLAEQWLNMDYTTRRQQMLQLRQQDEALYSMAKEIMTTLRRQSTSNPGA
jgi:hypothetical protein